MPLARWAFNIRQPLLLENVEPLVTRLTDDDSHGSDSSSRRPPNIVPVSNLLNFLPKSEADSLLQLRLEDDMRRALVGRLMIHAFFTAHHNCQWENLVFDNTESTKPVLVSPEHLKSVSYNISHHGDWVILVGNTDLSCDSPVRLGVDVMDFQEQVSGESFESFSACFQHQFTPNEITFMVKASSPESSSPDCASVDAQLKRFYRLWCLKESIVKALDINSDFDLKSIEFTIQDEEETEKPILSTVIGVHEPKPELLSEEGWSFEEALLDSDHCYAIAAQTETEDGGSSSAILDGSEIRRFDWKELLKDAVPYPVHSSA
ncbi:hypothetical protein K457DRAFT_29253 [Linnemannia elongata AG-77]|uniref:holo-[acyl-carrier-protein] synthase n=1 Tax=Linnemannia elongata AG-77 TaxID=1314771 RepID=A0A197K839_9FUNG|nr:hypothetical protein K457DRAFT_29253 [Linnemannia elongata AG-77]